MLLLPTVEWFLATTKGEAQCQDCHTYIGPQNEPAHNRESGQQRPLLSSELILVEKYFCDHVQQLDGEWIQLLTGCSGLGLQGSVRLPLPALSIFQLSQGNGASLAFGSWSEPGITFFQGKPWNFEWQESQLTAEIIPIVSFDIAFQKMAFPGRVDGKCFHYLRDRQPAMMSVSREFGLFFYDCLQTPS